MSIIIYENTNPKTIMASPKGHKPYPGCETGGRPLTYTKEFLDNIADEFLQWMEEDDSRFWLKDFFIDRRMHTQKIGEWVERSEKFRSAYLIAKELQERRMVAGGMKNQYNSNITKFALVNNHAWVSDKSETKVSGDAQNPLAFLLQSTDGKSKDLVKESDETETE
jgi:hypothetical protein